MKNIYVALNGDDVGTRIGQAIASDNHEDLNGAREAVKNAHDMLSQWAEQHKGKEISASGDESIYLLPESALQDIEEIKSNYSDISGHNLTVGIGNSMSEAAKALIYGKLNGKDQIVQYDPSIDEFLSQQDSDMQDEDQDNEMLSEDSEERELPEENQLEEQSDEDLERDKGLEDQNEDKYPEEDNKEEMESNLDDNDPYANEELDNSLDDEEDPDQDGDEGLEADVQNESLPSNEQDISEDEKSVYDNFSDESDNSKQDHQNNMSDMIHANIDQNEEQSNNQDLSQDDELRQDIAQSLMSFKENKAILESAKIDNPALYDATITMLRAMIEMAKKLGYAPEKEMESKVAEDQANQEFPHAESDSQDIESQEMPKEEDDLKKK